MSPAVDDETRRWRDSLIADDVLGEVVAVLVLSPVSTAITNRVGLKVTLAIGALVIALGFLARIGLDSNLWEIIALTSIAGAGTGIAYAAIAYAAIAYAAMPSLIGRAAPRSGLGAANGLNALCRSVGSSLGSAVGGSLFASQLVFAAGGVCPSPSACRLLFAICAAAALGAVIALAVSARQDAGGTAAGEQADRETSASRFAPAPWVRL